ncbi:MAG: hypothetical protein O7G86_08650 [Gammaproteobacteria bacterium]|nr:hypothetical protein [Gammaproteobacteria bacterium]
MRTKAKYLPIFAACLAMSACVTQVVRTVDMTPPAQFEGVQSEDELLDVGIAVFDANIPEDYDEQIELLIQPDIRRAEANFIPYVAKNLLQSTGNWGAVRVVPRPTHAVDVTISGKIIHSDGETLTIEATVRDATGRTWFTQTYVTLASKYAYDDSIPETIDPFQAVYKQLANDMLAYRQELTDEDIMTIRATAELKFAREFAPDAFSDHVIATDNGEFELRRLPSEDDPMLARVRKVREREYLFIDTLDEYYEGFYRSMRTPYQSWRKASYPEAIAQKELKAQARSRYIAGPLAIAAGVATIYSADSYVADTSGVVSVISGAMIIKSAIKKSAEAEIHSEVLQEIGVAAEAAIMPHTIELENQTVRLQGSVDEQYRELRKILRTIFFADLGLPEPAPEPIAEPEEESQGIQ